MYNNKTIYKINGFLPSTSHVCSTCGLVDEIILMFCIRLYPFYLSLSAYKSTFYQKKNNNNKCNLKMTLY